MRCYAVQWHLQQLCSLEQAKCQSTGSARGCNAGNGEGSLPRALPGVVRGQPRSQVRGRQKRPLTWRNLTGRVRKWTKRTTLFTVRMNAMQTDNDTARAAASRVGTRWPLFRVSFRCSLSAACELERGSGSQLQVRLPQQLRTHPECQRKIHTASSDEVSSSSAEQIRGAPDSE